MIGLSKLENKVAIESIEHLLGHRMFSRELSPECATKCIRFIRGISASVACSLSELSASSLRSIFMQSLHGAADLLSREEAYEALSLFFHTFNPQWTMESNCESTGFGKFAAFLSIMVCGELRIYFEENLCIIFAACESTQHNLALVEESNQRYEQRVSVCFSIVDSMLTLLIGDMSSDPADENVPAPGAIWSKLPATSLMSIQKVYGVIIV